MTTPTSQISQSTTPSITQSPPHASPQSPPAPITSQMLIENLLASPVASIDDLLARFLCTPQDIADVLRSHEFLTRFKLQTQIAYIQSRLAASRHLPDALEKTITLMHESEKPEVSRRAAAALIQMAGLPIRTRAQEAPTPMPDPPIPGPYDEADENEDEAACAGDVVARDLIDAGINIAELSNDDLFDTLRTLYETKIGPAKPKPTPSVAWGPHGTN